MNEDYLAPWGRTSECIWTLDHLTGAWRVATVEEVIQFRALQRTVKPEVLACDFEAFEAAASWGE